MGGAGKYFFAIPLYSNGISLEDRAGQAEFL